MGGRRIGFGVGVWLVLVWEGEGLGGRCGLFMGRYMSECSTFCFFFLRWLRWRCIVFVWRWRFLFHSVFFSHFVSSPCLLSPPFTPFTPGKRDVAFLSPSRLFIYLFLTFSHLHLSPPSPLLQSLPREFVVAFVFSPGAFRPFLCLLGGTGVFHSECLVISLVFVFFLIVSSFPSHCSSTANQMGRSFAFGVVGRVFFSGLLSFLSLHLFPLRHFLLNSPPGHPLGGKA
jgi:hypothetical protein